jgi:hypothetical protein
VDDELAPDYGAARARFLTAAGRLGLRTDHNVHPSVGPSGEELAIDTAWLGPTDASAVLVVVSGTHGVEGFAGSWCQSRWLESAPELPALPPATAVLFVHAFNPHGFAWVRRVNEDNVDVNRNFVDFAEPPDNPGYDELHAVLCPERWDEASQQATTEKVVNFVVDHGMEAVQAAISGGQYRHPDGLYYGGAAPTWSHRIMRSVWASDLAASSRIVVLDLHTGLGPWGHGELISHHGPGDPGYDRAVAWWGDRVTSISLGDSSSAPLSGEWMPAAERWVPSAEVTPVALEWGTIDMIEVGEALRADNWLHHHGDPRGDGAADIKAALRAAFAPAEPEWRERVWDQFVEVCATALDALDQP